MNDYQRLRADGYLALHDPTRDEWVIYRHVTDSDGYSDVADEPEGRWPTIADAIRDLTGAAA